MSGWKLLEPLILLHDPTLFSPRICRAGKCKDEGSSGGGDDAAELGIGKNFPVRSVCARITAKNVVHTNLSPDAYRCCLFTANVGGVFLVLGFGCLFALIVAIIEFLWNVKKVAVDEKVSWKFMRP